MSCIKTGAVVELPEYNTTIVADIHKVSDCIVIYFAPESLYRNPNRPVTHAALIGSEGYMSKARGIFVIPSDQFKEV